MQRGKYKRETVVCAVCPTFTHVTLKQEQTLFKDLRRKDIEIKNDETRSETS